MIDRPSKRHLQGCSRRGLMQLTLAIMDHSNIAYKPELWSTFIDLKMTDGVLVN